MWPTARREEGREAATIFLEVHRNRNRLRSKCLDRHMGVGYKCFWERNGPFGDEARCVGRLMREADTWAPGKPKAVVLSPSDSE